MIERGKKESLRLRGGASSSDPDSASDAETSLYAYSSERNPGEDSLSCARARRTSQLVQDGDEGKAYKAKQKRSLPQAVCPFRPAKRVSECLDVM